MEETTGMEERAWLDIFETREGSIAVFVSDEMGTLFELTTFLGAVWSNGWLKIDLWFAAGREERAMVGLPLLALSQDEVVGESLSSD